jgi:AraC-like DNA-binding protein
MESKPLEHPLGDRDLPIQPGAVVPTFSERKILESLSLLDLQGAARLLEEISGSLERTARSELPSAGLYAFELLSAINRVVWRGAAEDGRRALNRDMLVRAFSSLSSSADLRKAFDGALATLLAPFQGARPGHHPAIPRARAFIHETYHRKISLRQVAAHLGLSRTYLSTLFRRECGCTLTEYIHRVRLQKAQELIRSGTPALSQVASLVGYQNYRDFHRNFVRYQNASPKRFKHALALSGACRGPSPHQV